MNLLLCTVGQESNLFCFVLFLFKPNRFFFFKQGLFLFTCRSWRTCCLLDQSRQSSLETQRRSTCRTTTWARARHLVVAEKPTMTARMMRVVTTGQGFSVPTSSHKTHTHTHTQQCTAWGEDVWGIEWKRMFFFFLRLKGLVFFRHWSNYHVDPWHTQLVVCRDYYDHCLRKLQWGSQRFCTTPEIHLMSLNSKFRMMT